MPSKKHKPEEIIGKLREVEIVLGQGGTTAEACRRIAVSEQTYYRWRKEYGGLKTDQARRMKDLEKETSVLFELISARYERRSIMITANQPFGTWDTIFPDPAMTVAAIDRLVHHAVILEMNIDSYRRKTAQARSVNRRRTGTPDRHAKGTPLWRWRASTLGTSFALLAT